MSKTTNMKDKQEGDNVIEFMIVVITELKDRLVYITVAMTPFILQITCFNNYHS